MTSDIEYVFPVDVHKMTQLWEAAISAHVNILSNGFHWMKDLLFYFMYAMSARPEIFTIFLYIVSKLVTYFMARP